MKAGVWGSHRIRSVWLGQCWAVNSGFAMAGAMPSVPFCLFYNLGQAEDHSPDSGEPPGRKMGVSMVTADLGLVSMIRQGILALQLLPSNSSAGQ